MSKYYTVESTTGTSVPIPTLLDAVDYAVLEGKRVAGLPDSTVTIYNDADNVVMTVIGKNLPK